MTDKNNKKPNIKNICILVVFFAAFLVPIGALFFPSYKLPFDQVAPLPLVFSIGKERFIRETTNQFFLISTSGKEERFKFDKEYFSNLKGPHRRKVRIHTQLKRVNYKYFQEKKALSHFLCTQEVAKRYFKDDPIASIKVLDNNNHEILNLSCT